MNTESILNTLTPPPNRPWKVILALSLVGVAVGIAWWLRTPKETTHYRTTQLRYQSLQTTVSATGTLEPLQSVDVGTEVSGIIREVLVDYNDVVHIGQVLARLDPIKLQSEVQSSQAVLLQSDAAIREAQASLNNTQREWERVHTMYTQTNGNYPSKQDLDSAATELALAKAKLASALAQRNQSRVALSSARYNLTKTTIVSPINGVILQRKVEPGQTVVASMSTPVLFTIAEDLHAMQITANIDEADIGAVKEGQKVRFSVDAYPNRTFSGIITQVRLNSTEEDGVVTYSAIVSVDNRDLSLRPGMSASTQIITGEIPKALTVPNAALRFSPPNQDKGAKEHPNRGNTLWVLRQNKPIAFTIDTIGTNGSDTSIRAQGLHRDDRIITGIEEQP